jgi:broad specificity phosphatase PhoE
MSRLLIWRHGHTDWNGGDRVQGQTDVPLNELGRAQAAAAAARLAKLRPDAIVSSDLIRTADTAASLAAKTGLPVRFDARLRERFFGEWQGHTIDEIRRRWPREYADWRAGVPAPGCGIESLDDVGKRVGEALVDATEAAPGGTVVAVTHGGAARQGCGVLLGWSHRTLRALAGLDNCHWSDLRHDAERGWRLRAHNIGA